MPDKIYYETRQQEREEKQIEFQHKAAYMRETIDNMIAMLLKQMEHTREYYGFSKAAFSSLFSYDESYYWKIQNKGVTPNLKAFLLFCSVFDFDISEMLGRAYLDSVDSVVRETAVYLSGLDPETLQKINDVVQASNDTPERKNYGRILLDHLAKARKEDLQEPLYLFGSDIPKDCLDKVESPTYHKNARRQYPKKDLP